MKIWCEACQGRKRINVYDESQEEYDSPEVFEMCKKCNGKGYTESEKPTTEINIDYYDELKRKADFVDKMISPSANEIYKELNELKAKADAYIVINELIDSGDARLTMTDRGARIFHPYLSKIKEVIR